MRIRWRLPLFYQYLFSYILVLLIPLLITGLIVYYNFLGLTKQQELQKNADTLQQIGDVIDTKFSEFMSIVFQLSAIPGLSAEETEDPIGILNVSAALGFSVGNNAIQELVVYFHDADYLFSSDTTYTPNLFYSTYFQQEWSYDQFMEQLRDLQKPLLLPAAQGSPQRLIKYMLPLPYNRTHPSATAIFLIKENSLKALFNPVLKYGDSNSYVFDNSGNLILALREDRKYDNETIKNILRVGKKGSELITIDGSSYLLSFVKSSTTGWTYTTLVPEKEVMKPVNDMIYKGVTATGIIIALGFLGIYFGMRYNYHPLRKLIDLTDTTWGPVIQDNHGLHKIKAAIAHAKTLSETLQSQTESVGPALREYLLSELLRGRVTSREQLNEQGTTVGLKLKERCYFVQVIQFSQSNAAIRADKHELARQYLRLLPDEMDTYAVDMMDTQQVAFIVSSREGRITQDREFWHDIHRRFVQMTGIPATIGIGHAYDLEEDCSRLSISCIEAVTAVQYKAIKGSNQVIFFPDTAVDTPGLGWYPVRELERFELLLRKRDTNQALEVASELLQGMREQASSLYEAKHIALEAVNRVIRTMGEMNVEAGEQREYPDVLAFVRYESFEELEAVVMEVCTRACRNLDERNALTRTPLDDMMDYIEQRALSYDFSVQQMADHLGISKVHVSRHFKERTNQTVMEVVNELRMKEAKRLLKETDLPLQSIVERIGYADVSSFIRKFKQEMKLTPGEFRKL